VEGHAHKYVTAQIFLIDRKLLIFNKYGNIHNSNSVISNNSTYVNLIINAMANDHCYIKMIAFDGQCTTYAKLECGPMPNVMAALPNVGGALGSMPQTG